MLDTEGYKHTLRKCNTYCFATATMVARMHLNVTLYVHWLSCLSVSVKKNYYTYFISLKLSTDSVNVKLVSCSLKFSHLLHVGI